MTTFVPEDYAVTGNFSDDSSDITAIQMVVPVLGGLFITFVILGLGWSLYKHLKSSETRHIRFIKFRLIILSIDLALKDDKMLTIDGLVGDSLREKLKLPDLNQSAENKVASVQDLLEEYLNATRDMKEADAEYQVLLEMYTERLEELTKPVEDAMTLEEAISFEHDRLLPTTTVKRPHKFNLNAFRQGRLNSSASENGSSDKSTKTNLPMSTFMSATSERRGVVIN